MTDEGRMEFLESKLSHQEKSLSELSSELYAQARRLDRLESLVKEMAAKLGEAEDASGGPAPGDVRPPHW